MILSSLSHLSAADLARAKEDLKADEALFRSFLDQGLSVAQATTEMTKRGHGERYTALLARRVGPTETYILQPVLDEQTGLAKWPLSFKRMEKDVKLPGVTKTPKPTSEQPPTAV